MNEIIGVLLLSMPQIEECYLFWMFDAIMNKLNHKEMFFYSKTSFLYLK
jgi:hypothetical protein